MDFRTSELELRQLLSTALVALPATSASPMASSATPIGLTPAQVRQAYGLDNITFANGTIVGDGSGQTIAIVVAFDNPYIYNDLQIFNRQYGLPDSNFRVIKQKPSIRTNGGWGLEAALDVQWAHAIAPGADILLFEAKSDSLSDLMTMVNRARQEPGVVAVSMSWGLNEFAGERNYNSTFTTPAGHQGVTFVAASGDNGAWMGASFPAVSPNVLGVGGTQLTVSASGIYEGESGWSGSGGGYSKFLAQPSYQYAAQGSGLRTSPDIAWNAAVTSGVSVYSTMADSGTGGWFTVGGTSAGTPAWAAIIAIVDQGRSTLGLGSLAGAQSLIYSLPSSAFRDIASGHNGYNAGVGYDLVTGLGSPYVDRVVAGLISVPSTGNGNHVAAASPQRVRRLHRLRVRRLNEIEVDLDDGIKFTILASGSSSLTGKIDGAFEVTSIRPNQVFIVAASSGKAPTSSSAQGTAITPEIDEVPDPSVHPGLITITEHWLAGKRFGQEFDLEVDQLEVASASEESSMPMLDDVESWRDHSESAISELDKVEGIPTELIPQRPPALNSDGSAPNTLSPLGTASIISDLSGCFPPLVNLVSENSTSVNGNSNSDHARVFAAAVTALGGARLMREGRRHGNFLSRREDASTEYAHTTTGGGTRSNSFRYLMER